MKKSALKERIKKLTDDLNRLEFLLGLEKQQREMTAAKVDDQFRALEQDMAELKREFGPPAPSRVIPPGEWTKEEHEDHRRRQEEMVAARRVERLAAIAGQPSVTVTATEALTTAEHDMAGKLRELLGPMAPDYMRQIDVPVPHQPTHGEKVYYPEGCPPRTLFNPELINEYFRGKPTGEDVASWVIDALNFAVPSVAWCGTVGKIRDLNGEFKYRPWSSSHFVIGYDGKELGLFVSTPHGFKKSTERRIMTNGEFGDGGAKTAFCLCGMEACARKRADFREDGFNGHRPELNGLPIHKQSFGDYFVLWVGQYHLGCFRWSEDEKQELKTYNEIMLQRALSK